MKGYLTFEEGYLGAAYCARKSGMPVGDMKYFDWEKAKEIMLMYPDSHIEVGLREDWLNTSGTILHEGELMDPYNFYGASLWATPIIDVDGVEIECWTNTKTKEDSDVPDWVYDYEGLDNWEEKLREIS